MILILETMQGKVNITSIFKENFSLFIHFLVLTERIPITIVTITGITVTIIIVCYHY